MARPRKQPEGTSERKINALIWGPPGQGKTHFLGTAVFDERTAPIAIFDFDGGALDVLTGLPGEGTDWVRIPVQEWADFNTGFERMRENDEGFKSCAIDSLSETHIFALMNILDSEAGRRDNPDLIQQGDYGIGLVQLRRLTKEFKNLPIHTFFTAHDKQEVVAREGLITIPSMAGKAATEIPGMMTVSGYLALAEDEEGKTYRTLLLQNYAKIRTKVRTPWGVEAPDEINNPTVEKLLDALNYT